MFRFAVTIFVSAFLLFQVQPLIGRFILPWFGGGPSIWTSCMLFFQILLLGGYLYAHLTSVFLKTKTQIIVHLGLLGVSLLFLPIAPSDSWKPTADQSPLLQILLLLLATVGAPYFVLSSTGPLMQKWFSQAEPGKSPYRLYALSNIGSLLALLSYPFVFEPWLKLRQQTWSWSGVYLIYGGLVAWCAAKLWAIASKNAVPGTAQNLAAGQTKATDDGIGRPGIRSMLLWLGLAASSSIMLLATTNQLCIDVATVPFLWILPLCLYLISFIICFDSPQWYDRRVYGLLLLVCCPLAVWILTDGAYANIGKQVVIYSAILFVSCMVCHGELVSCRPHEKHLTLFYVLVSAGGALGGLFVAIVAPEIFTGYWEYHIGLVAVCVTTLLAWCSQKVWLKQQSPEFWAWLAVTVLNIFLVKEHLWGPLVSPGDNDGIEATDEVALFGIYALIQFAGLLLTSVLSSRRTALLVMWFTIAITSSAWLAGYSHWKLEAFMETKTVEVSKGSEVEEIQTRELSEFGMKALGILAVSAFASAVVAKDLANMMLIPGDVIRRFVLYAGILLLLFSDWLEQWQFISLAFTVVSGFLMELSAAGFRGREKPSVGFWFWVPAITLTLMLANQLKENVDDEVDESTVHVSRNFYGVLRVRFEAAPDFEDDGGGESRTVERSRNSLTHGQIKHGFQFREEDWKRTPTTYYGRKSGIGLAIANRREAAKSEGRGVRVGVVGLGTGTIAAYGEKGDYFRFYDINPDVRKLSDDGIFTYLSDSPAEKDVAIGDARIVMERELQRNESQQFDVLAIDAFSSDAIPVHLLTSECGEIYKQQIRPGGILAVHISNRYLNLSPVTRGMAEKLGWQALRISNSEDDNEGVFSSTWILLSSDPAVLESPDIRKEGEDWDPEDTPLHWTDDYSGLWQVLTL